MQRAPPSGPGLSGSGVWFRRPCSLRYWPWVLQRGTARRHRPRCRADQRRRRTSSPRPSPRCRGHRSSPGRSTRAASSSTTPPPGIPPSHPRVRRSCRADTATARSRVASAIARGISGPGVPGASPALRVKTVYPSFGYSAGPSSDSSEGSSSTVGYVLFTPHTRYVIGCETRTSTVEAGTRCAYVLETFRDTEPGRSRATPTIQGVVDAVETAWKAGRLSTAHSVATPKVLRDLIHSPIDARAAPPYCDVLPGARDRFTCVVTEDGTAGKLFVVQPVRARWKVVSAANCSGDLTHGTCYTLRTRGGAFP
jgi:hypothetical protein